MSVDPEPAVGSGPTEVELAGGTANRGLVVRVGTTVRRPRGEAADAVHALLRHVRDAGFDGAPQPLGFDERGREILTYLDGVAPIAPHPAWALTDDALAGVADLLRRYHDAVASFDPGPYRWPISIPSGFGPPLVSHNDPNLDNVVFRAGRAAGLIDFDLAAPGSRAWDLAIAARLWVPLRPEQDVPDERAGGATRRFRLLLEAYGLDRAGRRLVADAVVPSHDWIYMLIARGARSGHRGFGRYWTPSTRSRAARNREWCLTHAADLRRAAG